jgi:DNA replication licensing factor MCM5
VILYSQLEAIIRISESLAKISLSSVATEEHVEEALRLFRVSTIQAVNVGHSGTICKCF